MAAVIAAASRPASALAACELRSPAPLSEAGFLAFNKRYINILRDFGFAEFDENNPVSRTNVCPADQKLADTCVYAFTFTVKDPVAAPSFVMAGAVDLRAGAGNLHDLIVARDQVDAAGIRKKAAHALEDLEQRLSLLGFDWSKTTGNGVYCAHDIYHAVTDEISARSAAWAGVTWHLCRPPISGLEFEMDARAIPVERNI
jgi:hypothetical protein